MSDSLTKRAGVLGEIVGTSRFAPVPSRHVLVVPCYREAPSTLSPLIDSIEEDVLVVLVINEPFGADAEASESNSVLMDACGSGAGSLCARAAAGKLLALRCRQPKTGGAGAARRLGCQAAMDMMDAGGIGSKWIHHTDADCVLPKGYFAGTEASAHPKSLACLHPFGRDRRDATDSQYAAACAFESAIHLAQLWAVEIGSPYGVTHGGYGISVTRAAYEGIGGWSPTAYAEDTDLINRLLIGRVSKAVDHPVRVSCRTESRNFVAGGCPLEGHGAQICRIQDRLIAGGGIKSAAPQAWRTLGLVYALIRSWYSGAVEWDAPIYTSLEGIRGRTPKLRMGCAGAAESAVRECLPEPKFVRQSGMSMYNYWRTFLSVHNEQAILVCIQEVVDNLPLADAIKYSPFGVSHDGDWAETADRLASTEREMCALDAGLAGEMSCF